MWASVAGAAAMDDAVVSGWCGSGVPGGMGMGTVRTLVVTRGMGPGRGFGCFDCFSVNFGSFDCFSVKFGCFD